MVVVSIPCVCVIVRACVVFIATDDTTTNDAIGYCHGVDVSNIICNVEIYGHHTPNLYLEYWNTKKGVSNSIKNEEKNYYYFIDSLLHARTDNRLVHLLLCTRDPWESRRIYCIFLAFQG